MKSCNLIAARLDCVAGLLMLLLVFIVTVGSPWRTNAADKVGVAAWGVLGVWSPETYQRVRGDLLLENVTTFAEGSSRVFGLRPNGTVVGWWTLEFESPPPTTPGFVAIAAGTQHGVALRPDGTVVAWGNDQDLGVTSVPSGLNGVVALAAGYAHTLVLRGTGEVVAWGATGYGQSIVPKGLNRVKAIAARHNLSAAIRSDGSLVVWGIPYDGQTNVPVGLTRVAEVALGNKVVAARTESGEVVAWGAPGAEAPAGLSGRDVGKGWIRACSRTQTRPNSRGVGEQRC